MFFFDPTYILVLPALALALWAQWRVQSTYRRFSEVRAAAGITGRDMARAIMQRNGITDVAVDEVQGALSDHYDPRAKTVRLSAPNYEGDSVRRYIRNGSVMIGEAGLDHKADPRPQCQRVTLFCTAIEAGGMRPVAFPFGSKPPLKRPYHDASPRRVVLARRGGRKWGDGASPQR